MSKYDYEFERVNAYCYPDSNVLRNKLEIKDAKILDEAERRLTGLNLLEIKANPIKGKFDLKHLKAIHKYIFGDIYEWAGELRTVNIAKGNQFCLYMHLETYADGIFSELKTERLLRGTPPDEMPERLAYYLSEINVLHPFREGNGRAQRVFIEYLSQAAGWHIDFSDVSGKEMIEASAEAFAMEYDKMTAMLRRILSPVSAEERQVFNKLL
ncbi:MAG: Fic family protein [Oscillospiraceae bacterium]|nr:Fic family protein [Oscillospiraceae bacterium]